MDSVHAEQWSVTTVASVGHKAALFRSNGVIVFVYGSNEISLLLSQSKE